MTLCTFQFEGPALENHYAESNTVSGGGQVRPHPFSVRLIMLDVLETPMVLVQFPCHNKNEELL